MGLAGSVCPTWLRSAVTLRSGAGPPPPIVDVPVFIAGASAPWREMYTWGTEVALGYVPQTNIRAHRIHFANRGWGLVRESGEGWLLRTRGRVGCCASRGRGVSRRVSLRPRTDPLTHLVRHQQEHDPQRADDCCKAERGREEHQHEQQRQEGQNQNGRRASSR